MTKKITPAATPSIVYYLEKVLFVLCVSARPEYEKYANIYFYVYCILIYAVSVTLYILYLCIKANSYSLIVMSVLFINGGTSLYSILISVRLNKHYFLKCYRNILPDDKYVDDVFYAITHEKNMSVLKQLFLILFALTIGMSANPILAATLSDVPLGSLDTLISPQVFPWDVSTTHGYIAAIMYQAAYCSVAMSSSAAMGVFILINWIVIKSQYEMLKQRIESLDDIINNYVAGGDQQTVKCLYDQVMLDELAAVIEHHRHLNEISTDFLHAIKGSVTLSIFFFFSISVLLLSSILLLDGMSFFGKTKMLNILIVAMIFFIMKCNIGEYLNELNDEVKFLLYNSNWFEQSIPYRKRMLTFILLLQNQLKIKFMGTYDVNLFLLMSLLQKVYAGIQVLLTISL